MRLRIRHVTRYAYDPPALRLALRLRLWPSSFEAQRPEGWRVGVNGEDVPILFSDVQGEPLGLWHAHEAVQDVEIVAEGEVETEDAAGLVRGLGSERALGVWMRSTGLTAADPALDALADEAREAAAGQGRLAELHALMELIHARIAYRSGVTDPSTDAARALALGAGVCQDHTHVFLACARRLGSPARYVAGYLLAGDGLPPEDGSEAPDLDPHETHAWAEAHVEGLGWVGFDPSSGISPTDRHVRLCSGLDAAGAAPLRGSITGDASETLEARVDIARVTAESQSQQ